MGRTIFVEPADTLVINGWEVDAVTLAEVIAPAKRVLWAFIENDTGRLQPIAFNEEKDCIWLTEHDIAVGVDD